MSAYGWICGELTEVQRFIIPMRWCEQYPARERRELWITTDDRQDVKLVVHTRFMPARRGHRVAALLRGDDLLALLNITTGEGINFVRSDPPLLWGRRDGAAAVDSYSRQ